MLKTKLTTGLTSMILLSAVFTTPALADTDIRIAGNGSHSDNDVSVNLDRNVTVSQNNDTNISNNVSVNNNTGHNSVSGNTGGDVNVSTGDATASVNISNQAGSNVLNIDGCCDNGGANIKIEGNGSRSDNSVDFSSSSDLTVVQNNDTDIDNDVDVHNNMGYNSVDGNTWGDVTLQTGDAEANVTIHNEAGMNVANIPGCCEGGDTNISIVGNGSGSDNSVRFDTNSDRSYDQNNDTDFNKWFSRDHDFDFDRYDHNKMNRDYDHDKISYDWYQKYQPKHDSISYRKDHDKDYKDYGHMNYTVYKKIVYDRCDSKHWNDYSTKDWIWFKENCDHGKYNYHPVVYFDYDRYDHDNDNHKTYDRDYKKHDSDHYKKVTYKKNDYGHAKRNEGHKYVLTKYPKYDYDHNRNDYCKNESDGNYSHNLMKNYYPYHGGNTGGDVSIRTGDASANVKLHNAASSNYLNLL